MDHAKRALASEPNSTSYIWTFAAAQYRAGRAAAALQTLQDLARPGTSKAHVEAQPLLALIHARLGHREEARLWMKRTSQLFDQHLRAMKPHPLDWFYHIPGHHYDRLKLILLYREARELVPEAPPSEEVLCDILQARSHAYLGQLAQAECCFDRAIKRQPDNARVWLIRAIFRAQRGQWAPALADFDRARALGPLDDFWDPGFRAVVQLCQGDRGAYADTCREIVKRFGQTNDPQQAADLAWICSLAAGASMDSATQARLAECAGRGDPRDRWSLLAAGAALYRSGHYHEAVSRLRQALNGRAPENAPAEATTALAQLPDYLSWQTSHGVNTQAEATTALAQLFLSMALQRLGETSEAAQLLNTASDSINRAAAGEGRPPSGQGWHIWAACQPVRTEAESVPGLQTPRPPRD
jgi:tetratricopeptide (TPR) repeat protein